eukprot:2136678-Rhodomonas_salina.1
MVVWLRVKAGQSLTHATSSTSSCVADSGGTPSSVSVTVQVVIPHLSAASVIPRLHASLMAGVTLKMVESPDTNESEKARACDTSSGGPALKAVQTSNGPRGVSSVRGGGLRPKDGGSLTARITISISKPPD